MHAFQVGLDNTGGPGHGLAAALFQFALYPAVLAIGLLWPSEKLRPREERLAILHWPTMKARPILSKILFWLATPLGLAAFGFSIYFGIDVVEIWTRPAKPPATPLGPNPGLIELSFRTLNASSDLSGGIGDGIVQGLFCVSLAALVLAACLYWLSRKLRPPA